MDTPDADERTRLITELNDRVRYELNPWEVFMTKGINALNATLKAKLLTDLAGYGRFDPDDDPRGEHGFGSIMLAGQRVLWKIDYYTRDLSAGCATPWDATSCRRVLTLMLAAEY